MFSSPVFHQVSSKCPQKSNILTLRRLPTMPRLICHFTVRPSLYCKQGDILLFLPMDIFTSAALPLYLPLGKIKTFKLEILKSNSSITSFIQMFINSIRQSLQVDTILPGNTLWMTGEKLKASEQAVGLPTWWQTPRMSFKGGALSRCTGHKE